MILFRRFKFLDRLADKGTIGRAVHIASCGADHPGLTVHLTGTEPAIERGQELSARQISCPAKDDKVERIYRNNARDHGRSFVLALHKTVQTLLLDFRGQKGQVGRENANGNQQISV